MKNKKAAPHVIEYLEMMRQVRGKPPKGFTYNGIEDLILKEGEVFIPAPLPNEIKRGRMKRCYRNATEAALRVDGVLDGWQYTEGVALSEGLIPVQHAWLSRNGVAVDPTWTDGVEYVGITFSNTLMSLITVANRYYGLIEDYRNGYPMLRNKFDAKELENIYAEILKKG